MSTSDSIWRESLADARAAAESDDTLLLRYFHAPT